MLQIVENNTLEQAIIAIKVAYNITNRKILKNIQEYNIAGIENINYKYSFSRVLIITSFNIKVMYKRTVVKKNKIK